jgi:hypothetical protein
MLQLGIIELFYPPRWVLMRRKPAKRTQDLPEWQQFGLGCVGDRAKRTQDLPI